MWQKPNQILVPDPYQDPQFPLPEAHLRPSAASSSQRQVHASLTNNGFSSLHECLHLFCSYLLDLKDTEPALHLCKRIAETNGWRTVVETHGDGEDALRLLKLRDWDAAFIDNDLSTFSGTTCLVRFRDWEKLVRANQQKDIYIMSDTYSTVALPTGFDGVLMKPLDPTQLLHILGTASFKLKHTAICVSKT